MFFTSTRSVQSVTSAAAITRGIAADGGLFVPESFPQISFEKLVALADMDYISRAKEVLKLYLTDYTEEELAVINSLAIMLKNHRKEET